MNKNERREYIAEKIFEAKKKFRYHTWIMIPGKEFHPPFDWQFPDGRIVDSKTDFESLPEWAGSICEVILPMLAEREWIIVPGIGGLVDIFNSELTELIINELNGPQKLQTALVDAHIKIEKEKKQQRA
ncbi:hypothetical protein [Leptospira santarosai]|uniref:hypothetical protein n=1 Tax=Leptospira santarosai TaxID=28183 RepID=UPI000314D3C7|nr:hypothetical protein [Leptospira santarosai]MDI7225542.1 hypothetical protein [Leptospira santarosai]